MSDYTEWLEEQLEKYITDDFCEDTYNTEWCICHCEWGNPQKECIKHFGGKDEQ